MRCLPTPPSLRAGVATAFALAVAAPPLASQDPARSSSLPEGPTTDRVVGLVEALSSGSRPGIRAFIDTHYTSSYSGFGSAQNLENYWAAVYQEVGPLSVEVFETLTLGPRQLQVYWARGHRTRSWIGIRLDVDTLPPYQIEGNSVLRGARPRSGPRPDRAAAGADPLDVERLAAYLDEWLSGAADEDHFSGAVALWHGGQPIYLKGFGLADRERAIPVSPETPFRLASVTKMFTGVAIAQLAERGQLSYDDPLSKFIPEYPSHIADQVTVHHLLTHTSGIEIDDDRDFNDAVRVSTSMGELLEAQLRFIRRLNRGNYDDFAPLTEFDYTNEGIDLLGIIVERVSGSSWSTYLQDHVFAPAGMTRTGPHVLEPPVELAVPYTSRGIGGGWSGEGLRAVPPASMVGSGRIRPAGSGWSTARDMARFVQALRDGTLLSAESYSLMTTPHIVAGQIPGEDLAYGYTLNVDRRNGLTVLGHGGGAPGINTHVRWYPQGDWIVVVLANRDRGANHVSWHIEELIGAR